MTLVVVIDRETLAQFNCRRSDDMIGRGVVGRLATKDFHPYGAFFNLFCSTLQRLLNDVA